MKTATMYLSMIAVIFCGVGAFVVASSNRGLLLLDLLFCALNLTTFVINAIELARGEA